MKEKSKNELEKDVKEKIQEDQIIDLEDDDVDELSGGVMQGNIVKRKTTPISQSTKTNI